MLDTQSRVTAQLSSSGHRPLRLLLAGLATLIVATGVLMAGAERAAAALLTVTTTQDLASSSILCSLRMAIDAVNSPGTATPCGTADPTSNYIVLQSGTYALTIPRPLTGSDDNSSGDLNVTGTDGVTILGQSPLETTIAAGPGFNDRLFTVGYRSFVGFAAVTLAGGHAPDGTIGCPGADGSDGGAILNYGLLSLNIAAVAGSQAGNGGPGNSPACTGGNGGNGGGVANDCITITTKKGVQKFYCGTVNADNTQFLNGNQSGAGGVGGAGVGSSNGGNGGRGGFGAAIYNSCYPTVCGQAVLTDTTFAGNAAGAGGPGGAGGSSGGDGGSGGNGGWGGAVYANGSLFNVTSKTPFPSSLTITNDTFAGNTAGAGGTGGAGAGGGADGTGGTDGNGGAVAVDTFPTKVLNATIAGNGAGGKGSGLYVTGPAPTKLVNYDMTLQNSIAANNDCGTGGGSAVIDGGHNLSYPSSDITCPAAIHADPMLMPLAPYGGFTETMALEPSSPAINAVPATGTGCPPTDERTAIRPQGPACDIGAFEFAKPHIKISTPRNHAHYKRNSKVKASYQCTEGGINALASAIATCTGTVADGKRINTSKLGKHSFKVTATDLQGNTKTKTVHYTVVKG